jgi:hypothetical protein
MKSMLFPILFVGLLLLSACSSNLQENKLAVPVKVDRKVVSVDTINTPPTNETILESNVISVLKYSPPEAEEFIPITVYKPGSLWFASGYEAAKTRDECETFLKDWSKQLDPNFFRLGFCARRHPEAQGTRLIAEVTQLNL